VKQAGRPGTTAALLLFVALLLTGGAAAYGIARSREAVSPARELRPTLFAVRSGGGAYLYAVRLEDQVVLIDAGPDPEGRPLALLINAARAETASLAGVWLTNARPDHRGGVAAPAVRERKLFVGAADGAVVRGESPGGGWSPRALSWLWSSAPRADAQALNDGDTWVLGPASHAHEVRAWATPGPTPGSISYLVDDVLFVGDLMGYREGRLVLPPAPLDEAPTTTLRSVREMPARLGPRPFAMVCTGHGGCTPDGAGPRLLAQLLASLPR